MNQNQVTPKDFFLHLGAIIALYVSVGALINLSFSIIDYYFPDVLGGYFYGNVMAWPISMLIVLVPILYIIEGLIKKDEKIVPEKGNLWIKRWRVYLTIFLTGLVLAGDLIALINIYLSGEISTRFIFKFLAILIVLSTVFTYYLLEKMNRKQNFKRILSFVGLVLVIVSIVIGFITVGSPNKQRSMRFDYQRITDLQNIQWQVVNHWQTKGTLPSNLDSLKDSISGYEVPKDPKTDESYEFRTKGPLTFELCANFDLAYEDTKGRGESAYGKSYPAFDGPYPATIIGGENWKHDKGRTCFERIIDPAKYPKQEKSI